MNNSHDESISLPQDLKSALQSNKKAQMVFDNFPPSHKKEYIKWIKSAKKDETRMRRIEKTIEKLNSIN